MIKRSVKKNVLFYTIFQIIELLVPLITTPYVSRVLKPANIGIYSFASARVTYFVMFATLGSSVYGQRKVAYVRDNCEDLSNSFWNLFLFRCVTSTISLVLYIITITFIGKITPVTIIVALSIVNVALDISWFYQGLEDFKSIAVRTIIIRLVCLIGIFIFVKKETDLGKYVFLLSAAQILGSLSIWFKIKKYIKKPITINLFKDIREIWSIFMPTIATQVYMVLDKLMLGIITKSNYQSGCYEQSEKIARLVLMFVLSIGTVIMPRISNLYHNDDLENAKIYLYKAFRMVWLIAFPLMFGMMGVSSVFIPLFLGKDYVDSIILLCIFSGLIVSVGQANVVGISYLIPTRQQKIYTIAVTVSAIVNLIINIILIPQYGAFGAAVASVLAETIGTGIQISYCIVKKQLSAKMIFDHSFSYLFASIIMYICILGMKRLFASGILELFLIITSGAIVYILILFAFKDQYLIMYSKSVCKTLINRVSR